MKIVIGLGLLLCGLVAYLAPSNAARPASPAPRVLSVATAEQVARTFTSVKLITDRTLTELAAKEVSQKIQPSDAELAMAAVVVKTTVKDNVTNLQVTLVSNDPNRFSPQGSRQIVRTGSGTLVTIDSPNPTAGQLASAIKKSAEAFSVFF